MDKVRLAVVGAGYWGINHVRAFARLPGVELTVCEVDDKARAKARGVAPNARFVSTYEEVCADPTIDGVVLATPVVDHARQALAALHAGKHVFVEKPMSLTASDAREVVAAADAAQRTLMVGHLMLYHPAFRRLVEMVRGGDVGQVYYLYALRVNLGRLRRDENALWSFAPHDISMILDLVPSAPLNVTARGESYLQPGVEDVVFVNIAFADRTMAQIQLSWLDPRKERRLTVVGSKKMVELDDAHPTEKLRIYDKGYDRPPEFTQYGEYLTVRQGDIHIPRVDASEPLELECKEFVSAIRTGTPPRTDGRSGQRVVEVLEAADRSMKSGGAPVALG